MQHKSTYDLKIGNALIQQFDVCLEEIRRDARVARKAGIMTKEIEDGGPAYPHSIAISPMGDVYTSDYSGGCMSLRDYLAAAALPVLMGAEMHGGRVYASITQNLLAAEAYKIADAMLKARKEPSNG